MKLVDRIRSLIKEAEVYYSQGLLDESYKTYETIQGLIQSSKNIKNKDALLQKISSKIDHIQKKHTKQENSNKAPRVRGDAQKLIKEMFSFTDPETKGSSSLGGAIALAKFGQYEQAIDEFSKLLEDDLLRLEAAKNILWCWHQQDYSEYGISLFQKWQKAKFFPKDQLEEIRVYFQSLLNDGGIDEELDGIGSKKTIEPDSELTDDDIIDINAVRFILPAGPSEGEKVDLDVSFQSGKYIRLIISRKDKQMLKGIKPGDMLQEIIFYSPMAIFAGTGFLSSIKEIEAGPKRGDYSMEIKIIKILS